MSDSVEMPALGESVTEGTVTRWLKAVGDTVAVDEPLLEVSTDKVDTEIPSPVAGVLQEILVDEDETVEVGARLAVIGDGASGGSSNGQPQQQDAAQQEGQPAEQEHPAEPEQQDDAQSGQGDAQQDDAQQDEAQQDDAQQDDAQQDAGAEPAAEQEQPAQQEQPQEQPAQQDQPQQDQAASPPSGGGSGDGTPVTMPALGESVTEGTVTRWLKQEGDTVEVDEPLLEVSTDKVDTEIPSPVAGTVQKILVGEDETVEVGAQLALVGSGSGGGSGGGSDAAAAAQQEQPAPQEQPSQQRQEQQPEGADAAAGSLEEEAQQQERAGEQAEQQTQPDGEDDAREQAAEQESTSQESAPQAGSPQEGAPEASPPQETGRAPAEPEQAKDSSDSDYSTEPQTTRPQPTAGTQPPGRSGGGDSTYVTPLVRKLASEHEVDLSGLQGTGVGGRIRKQDVLEAAEKARAAAEARRSEPAEPSQPASSHPASSQPASGRPASGGDALAGVAAKRGTTEKMTRLRKVIAQRMVESLQTSAQLTTVVEVDVTKIARLRGRAKRDFEAREGVKLSFLPFFALATVEALKAHARVNASVEDDQIVYHAQENLGVAVDTERGLLVPVIKDAGDLNIAGLARKIADLAARTRDNKITPDELGGGTFTLTNTGSRGALFDTPIINQPQVGILGTGSVVKRPVVVVDADGGETIAIRSMVYLALSYDHRLVDGADAARFLTAVKERLEEGAFDADLGL